MNKIKVSVIGASGYGGAEAVRLLTTHPHVDIIHVTAETQQGQIMSTLYPNLRGFIDQTMIAVDAERIGHDSDVTFVSLPSGKAMHLVPALLEQGCKVIDIGVVIFADVRPHCIRCGTSLRMWRRQYPGRGGLWLAGTVPRRHPHDTAVSQPRLLPHCLPARSWDRCCVVVSCTARALSLMPNPVFLGLAVAVVAVLGLGSQRERPGVWHTAS